MTHWYSGIYTIEVYDGYVQLQHPFLPTRPPALHSCLVAMKYLGILVCRQTIRYLQSESSDDGDGSHGGADLELASGTGKDWSLSLLWSLWGNRWLDGWLDGGLTILWLGWGWGVLSTSGLSDGSTDLLGGLESLCDGS